METITTSRKSPAWLIVLATLSALGPVSIDLYLPAFSAIKQEFGAGVENSLAAYLFGVAVGQLVYGPVSDRFGRKPPLYVAMALYIGGSLACSFASGMTQLIVARLVQALGGCAGMAIARAVVRDSYEPRHAARAFSTLMMIGAVAPILAPTLGGWIVRMAEWRVVFWVQAAFGLALLLGIYAVLPETRDAARAAPLRFSGALRNYLVLLKDRQFIGNTLIGACAIATIFCYISGAPTVLTETYGISPHDFGWIMSLSGLSFVFANQLNLRRLRRHSPRAILRVAVWMPVLLGGATAIVLSLFALPVALVIALQLGMFVAIGHIVPNVAAEALAQRGEDAGAASALMGSVQSLGSTAAGFAVAAANDGSMRTIAVLMGLSGALMLLVRLTLLAPTKHLEILR